MKTTFYSACLTAVFALSAASMQAMAQADAVAPPAAGAATTTAGAFSQEELDQMMAPIALYPDSLLSQILMGATYPDQIAQAAKWSKANPDQKGDDAVTAVQDQGWDPSVASLVAFPQVLDIMSEKPDWVKTMGDAFLAEPEAVMSTVQSLRKKAKDAGNLESSDQQTVIIEEPTETTQQTIITIEPADPQVVYVPAYNPTVIYGPWWYPAYPPFYYYPPGYGIATAFWTGVAFGIGIGITNSLWGGCNWRRGDVNINVNRYNNINVNNRINASNKNVSWKNRNTDRRNKARADLGNRKRGGNKLGGSDRRKDFRGRDAQRDNARSTLKNKGLDPAAERKNLKGKGGDRVRDQVGKIDRSGNLGSAGGRLGDRGGANKGGNRGAAGLSDRRTSTSTGKRDFSGAASKRSGNALQGLGSSHSARQSSDRGRSSNRSFERRGGGNRSFGGGGGGFGGRGGGGGGHFGGRR